MLKECPSCQDKVAAAKKTCKCGHVFLAKKTGGFKEMPIILTPDRLRQTAGRPIRTKKPKDHGGDFVYNNISKTTENNSDMQEEAEEIIGSYNFDNKAIAEIEEGITEESSDENLQYSEKIKRFTKTDKYPKRDRNKTPKYEIFQMTKKKMQPDKNFGDSLSIEPQIYSDEADSSVQEDYGKDEEIQEKGATINVGKVRFESSAGSSEASSIDLQIRKQLAEPNEQVVRSPSVVMLRKLDGKFFTENIDAHIEIQLSDDTIDPVDFTSNPGCSTEENRVVLSFNSDTNKMLVTRESTNTIKDEKTGFESMNMKRNAESGIATIADSVKIDTVKSVIISTGKEIKVKKPVGRPRKNVEVKPKRPVGRPRKNAIPLNYESQIRKIPDVMSFPTMVDVSTKSVIEPHKILNGSPVSGERKRGRPKGSKDTKKRKIRTDRQHIIREPPLPQTPMLSPKGNNRFFLSPPSLIANAKRERMRNEMLETVEIESLQEKLNVNASWIPPSKQELFSLILDDINRRILSQSFNVL